MQQLAEQMKQIHTLSISKASYKTSCFFLVCIAVAWGCIILNREITLKAALYKNENLTKIVIELSEHKGKCGEEQLQDLQTCRRDRLELREFKGKFKAITEKNRVTDFSLAHEYTYKFSNLLKMVLATINAEKREILQNLEKKVDKQAKSITRLEEENKNYEINFTECARDNVEKQFCAARSETHKKELAAFREQVEAMQNNLTELQNERDKYYHLSDVWRENYFRQSIVCTNKLEQCRIEVKHFESKWKNVQCWLF